MSLPLFSLITTQAASVISAQDPVVQASIIATAITAFGGIITIIIGYLKWSREQGAKEKADAVALAQASSTATIAALNETVTHFQDLVVRQEGRIGELASNWANCKAEREAQDIKIASQDRTIAQLRREVDVLKGDT